jgi:hypothetical protein
MLLVAIAIAAVIGLPILALMLCAAAYLYNKIAGGPTSPMGIPRMTLGRSLAIVVLTAAVMGFLGLVIGLTAAPLGFEFALYLGQLIVIPVSFSIMASLVAAVLPTTFMRGVLVTLCYQLVSAIVVVVIAGIVSMFR